MNPCKLLILLLFTSVLSFAQTDKDKLQRERNALQREIEQANKMLNETSKNRELTIGQLQTLNRAIAAREKLVSTIQAEIAYLQKSASSSEQRIDTLQVQIDAAKEEYAKLIKQAYKSRSAQSKLMFLFSSSDFNQAYRRLRYMQEIANFRKEQSKELIEKQKELQQTVNSIKSEVAEKEQLIAQKVDEQEQLRGQINEKNRMVSGLKKKERQLKAQIRAKEKAAKDLQAAIEKIIKAEIKASTKSSGGSKMALTPESKELAASFTAAKGGLPWPVERGVIIGKFGAQPHPVYPSLKIENNGVKIRTEKGMNARAAYKGVVNSILVIPGNHKAVILIHGDYLTVYSNLEEVYVTRGQKVEAKQLLGKVHTDRANGETVLEFQIWKNTEKLNPESWLTR